MKGKLIGVARKSGVFRPKDKNEDMKYDNLMLYVLERIEEKSDPSDSFIGEGYYLQVIKLKMETAQQHLSVPVQYVADLNQYIGTEVEYYYNKFGNVDRVDFC